MRYFAAVRLWLRTCLLRGPLLRWWLKRRCAQWEQAYRTELSNAAAAHATPAAPAGVSPRHGLNHLLVIADCMWEKQDLLPELALIAPTRLLDLHSQLGESAGRRERIVAATAAFLRENSHFEADAILLYLRPSLLSEELFHTVRKRWKCPLLGMNLDDKAQFFPYSIFAGGDDNYRRWAREFDLNITNCLPATEWYRHSGLPVIYSPSGIRRVPGAPPPTNSHFRYPISFVGSIKPERKMVVDQVLRAGIPLELFGKGWPKSQWIDDQNDVFRNSQLNLGIGFASPSQVLTTVKGRDFECPGAGACYVTTYNWELPFHFEIGKEILCYRSIEELIEIYAYYRNKPEECLRIAQAAWRRCQADHTWERRFRTVFRQAGFSV